MKSGQILNALNAQSHKKHAKPKLSSIPEESPHQSLPQNNEFSQVMIPETLPEPPSYFMEILEQQRQQKLIPQAYQDQISKVRKQRQSNVYLSYIEQQSVYLTELVNQSTQKNSYGNKIIQDVLHKRFNLVSSDIQSGKLFIDREKIISTKQQENLLNELDKARLLKIKEGTIRSKIGLLNQKMQEMQRIQQNSLRQNNLKQSQSIDDINKKIADNLDIASYSLKSQKTKIASDYVKHMSEQRRQQKKRQKMRQQRQKKIELERLNQIKQAQQIRDLTKKQQLLKRIQQKRKARQQQEKMMQQKQANIQKFLANYKKQMPIFRKKQKEYVEKYVKPQKKYREQKLKQIKQKKKSYSLNDIVSHQKKYEELRKLEDQKKASQKQVYIKSLKINHKQHYRGSIHSVVQQVDKQAKQKNLALYRIGKNRKQRMQEYCKNVLPDKKPKIDEKKRKQLLRSLELQKMKKQKLIKKYKQVEGQDGQQIGMESFYEKIPQKNRYKEGNKFMQYSKMKRNKKITSNSLQIEIENEQENKKVNTKALKKEQSRLSDGKAADKQIWEIRSKQIEQMSNNITSPKQFQQIKANFINMDEKAMKRQEILKLGKMSLEDHLDNKNVLDQFYIESIKNKMKLLDD